MARYDSPGDSLDYTPVGAVAVGTIIPLGSMCGVATRPIEAGKKGALAVEGVFYCEKKTGASTDWAVGTPVYYDESETHVTHVTDSGANTLVGLTTAVTTTVATEVPVKLSGAGPVGATGATGPQGPAGP